MIKINRKINEFKIMKVVGVEYDSRGIGIKRTISISNTTKMMANKKKRIENGTRAVWLGSNPHSNGDAFSRLEVFCRKDTIQAIENTAIGRITATMVEIIKLIM